MQNSCFLSVLSNVPCWLYWSIALIVSGYHGYRGYTLQHSLIRRQKDSKEFDKTYWTKSKLFWVREFYDTVFYFACSFVGFISFKYAISLFVEIPTINDISGGFSAFVIALFTIGFLGILGILPHLIYLGKVPKI